MKTDELIAALAADKGAAGALPLPRIVSLAWLSGWAVAAAAFFAFIGLRPDIAAALESPRFVFKVALVVALAVAACGCVLRLARPGARLGGWRWALLGVAGAIVAASIVELAVTAPASWSARLIGSNVASCLTLIPLLSIAPAIVVLFALRRGAPTRPGLAGAAAGMLAAASAAALYALNCTDDSPLFVIVWYTLAGGLVATVTGVVGARILRW
ncbi:MAG: NrsF family protein [Alphaproteobacteria bacterium]